MRGLVIFLVLSTGSAFAESRVVEVCKPGSPLIKEINDGARDEYLINARHYLIEGTYPRQSARREALAQLLTDPGVILNTGDGGPHFNVLAEVDHDGAVLARAPGATLHDCINVHVGDRAWRRLTQVGLADQ